MGGGVFLPRENIVDFLIMVFSIPVFSIFSKSNTFAHRKDEHVLPLLQELRQGGQGDAILPAHLDGEEVSLPDHPAHLLKGGAEIGRSLFYRQQLCHAQGSSLRSSRLL